MNRLVMALFGVVAAGCYTPEFPECVIACGVGNSCPTGLTCHDGRCGRASCGVVAPGVTSDGAPTPGSPDGGGVPPIPGLPDGGGAPPIDGPETPAPDTASVPPDLISPLTVTMVTPTGEGIDPGTPTLTLQFSAPVASSVAGSLQLLQGEQPVELPAPAISGSKVTFALPALALRTSYTVVVKKGLADATNQMVIAEDQRFPFATREGSWGMPVVLAGAVAPRGQPALAMNPAGNAVAFFFDVTADSMGEYPVYAHPVALRFDPATSQWKVDINAQGMPKPELGNPGAPEVGINADGQICAAWSLLIGQDKKLYASWTKGPGVAWKKMLLSTYLSEFPGEPRLALFDTKQIPPGQTRRSHLCGTLWSTIQGGVTPQLLYQTLIDIDRDGVGTGKSMLAQPDRGRAVNPSIAGVPAETVAAWEQPDNGRQNIHARTGYFGTDKDVVVSNTVADAHNPVVALDPQGNAMLAWHQQSGAFVQILTSRKAAGGSWSAPEAASAASTNATLPSLAADRAGNFVVTWQQTTNMRRQLFAARWTVKDAKWTAAVPLSAASSDVLASRLALDASGNGLVVWLQPTKDDVAKEVLSARHVAGSGWQAAMVRSTEHVVSEPRVALDARGRALLLWRDGRGVVALRFQ
jgi:hypothetical protein